MFKYLFFLAFFASTAFSQASEVIKLNDKNTVSLNDYVTDESVQRVVGKARELDRLYPNAGPIYLVIHSGGGSIQAGIEMINNLKTLHRPIHTVTIFAASMAFHTVQALGTRYVLPLGTLMQHKAKGGFQGEFPNGNIDSEFSYWVKRVLTLEAVTAVRAKYPQADLQRKFDNEYWCNAADCVRERFADKIVTAECDSSLSGSYKVDSKKYVDLVGGGIGKMIVSVEYASCPLQTAPLGIEIQVTDLQGNPLNSAINKSDFKSQIEDFITDTTQVIPRIWFRSRDENKR